MKSYHIFNQKHKWQRKSKRKNKNKEQRQQTENSNKYGKYKFSDSNNNFEQQWSNNTNYKTEVVGSGLKTRINHMLSIKNPF